MSEGPAKIFVSYSRNRKDASALGRLQTHLQPLIRSGAITLWDDTQIRPGELWRDEINRALDAIAGAVLLVSADFLASDFINAREIPQIMSSWRQRGIKIYWVLLSQVRYQGHPLLEGLQAVNTGLDLKPLDAMSPGQREQVWATLADWIARDLGSSPTAPAPLPPAAAADPLATPSLGHEGPDEGPPYIERPTDREVLAYLRGKAFGATVTLKGHRQVGKTSLLARIHASADANGVRPCFVDFQELDEANFEDITALFRSLAWAIASALDLDLDPAATDWSDATPAKMSFSQFVERHVLGRAETSAPVLLLLDEVDRAFEHPIHEELFSLLRVWHNKRAYLPLWKRLGMVLAHATDPALWITDLKQSPFNVGHRAVLDDFERTEVVALGNHYGLALAPAEVDALVELVGGHPYLVNLAFYTLRQSGWGLDRLRAEALAEGGPFLGHLRELLGRIEHDDALLDAVRTILRAGTCTDRKLFQKLWSAGLVRELTPGLVGFRDKLHETFFRQQLLPH